MSIRANHAGTHLGGGAPTAAAQNRQPLRDRRRFIIDDVVHARHAALDCCCRGGCSVGDVNEGPYSLAVAHQWKSTSKHVVDMRSTAGERGSRAIEGAVAQDNAFDVAIPENCSLQILNCRQSTPELRRGSGIEEIPFAFDWTALSYICSPCKALRDDSPDASRPRGRERMIGRLSA
jgi:hypothetical protein